ncbi:hepatic triacylglycerol lipase [Panthera uncia]|uniref:hepatic triacylglycerol lipase n=1 Tax=Panthera uncia TaxID=29064 RepID=UPI0020FFC9E0|nr:hepatic triacylglycerol lipase [Panthera uncia]
MRTFGGGGGDSSFRGIRTFRRALLQGSTTSVLGAGKFHADTEFGIREHKELDLLHEHGKGRCEGDSFLGPSHSRPPRLNILRPLNYPLGHKVTPALGQPELAVFPLHLFTSVYHYQFKIQFINQLEKPVEPTFTMTLLGTKEENQKITITLDQEITSNKTYSFLITLDLDIGELVMIKFKWENGAVWTNVWNTVQTIIPWSRRPLYSGLVAKTIRVKAGETQQRMTFCSENTDGLQLQPTQEKTFVRCNRNSKKLKGNIR